MPTRTVSARRNRRPAGTARGRGPRMDADRRPAMASAAGSRRPRVLRAEESRRVTLREVVPTRRRPRAHRPPWPASDAARPPHPPRLPRDGDHVVVGQLAGLLLRRGQRLPRGSSCLGVPVGVPQRLDPVEVQLRLVRLSSVRAKLRDPPWEELLELRQALASGQEKPPVERAGTGRQVGRVNHSSCRTAARSSGGVVS
jgi:hypothetical protein